MSERKRKEKEILMEISDILERIRRIPISYRKFSRTEACPDSKIHVAQIRSTPDTFRPLHGQMSVKSFES